MARYVIAFLVVLAVAVLIVALAAPVPHEDEEAARLQEIITASVWGGASAPDDVAAGAWTLLRQIALARLEARVRAAR